MGVSTHSNRSPGLGSIPVALIYSFFVEYYVEGLTAGSVKS
jgi:ABC-type maltose transport system permease subunit